MKFDKRLVESGIVAAFSLMLSVSSVYGANAATQAPDDQTVELSAEPAEVSDKAEAAAKVRTIREVVAASVTENEPEQKAKEQESPQEDTEGNASGAPSASVGILAEALKEETSGTESKEHAPAQEATEASELEVAEGKVEKPSEAEGQPEESKEAKTEESGQAEAPEKTDEASDIEETEEKAEKASGKEEGNEEEEKTAEEVSKKPEEEEKTSDEANGKPEEEEKTSHEASEKPEEEEKTSDEADGKPKEASKAEEEQKPEDNGEESQEGTEETPAEAAEGESGQAESDEAEEAGEPARDGLVKVGSQEVSPWAAKLLPNVEDYLNIRTEPSDEAELAGKLHKGASADILEQGEEWTKISSGSVEGYVKNEFCVTGLAAEELANQVGTVYATAVTGGVRIREQASTSEDTTVMDVLEEGGKAKVDTEAEAPEGWVAVKMAEGVGYVSAEYVDVELKLGKAISIEEEQAAIAAAEAEKARKAKEAQAASGGTSQRGAVAASYDDVTLLGALIQCEAGSEPYEGKLAVGAVVMNRLRAGYAGSISGVIYQSGQFTPASSGALARVLASGVSGSCIQAAQEAIGGASNVGGATSFRNAASGASGIVIGNHVFF